MRVSFVIPAYNEEAYLAGSLAALQEEIARNGSGIETEIIVVDNASTDRTADIAKGFPGVRVTAEPVKGLACAKQHGFEEAVGDIVAFLDADTQPLPGWLATITREFEADPQVVCVSGPYFYHDLPRAWRSISWPYEIVLGSVAHFLTGQCIAGGNMAVRREALSRAGGFDREIVFYGEDLEAGMRLRKVGKIVFTPRLCVSSSARRFNKDGIIKTTFLYAGNFLSQAVRKRPIHNVHRDIR